MKNLNKKFVLAFPTVLIMLGIFGSTPVLAATSPSLGTAATYGIVSSTYTNSLNAGLETDINGDVCYTTGPATAPISISGATVVPCPPAVGTDQSNALANLNGQACTSLGAGAVSLNAVIIGANPAGTFPPGCYSSGGAMDIVLGTTVTLNGAGTYIFRPGGALTTGANSLVTLAGGASACDVFWTPSGDTTIGANASTSATPTFVGNIINNALNATQVTLGHFVNLEGTVLAFGRTVTTDSNTITVPICAAAPGTLHVVKNVVNDDTGVSTASNFNLHVTLLGVDVAGSPAAGAIGPVGTAYSLAPGTYVVSEDAFAGYTTTFGGDCDAAGNITLTSGADLTCTVTNNDIAPLPATISVVKTVINDNGGTKVIADFPLFVNGVPVVSGIVNVFPAPATYTVTETVDPNYTRTFSGDCSAGGVINLVPGDNQICIVTNNDIAPSSGGGGGSAPVPPHIAVVKVPDPLALPAGPGDVTYTYTLRNTGTVSVTDITMVGDTCSPITLVSGDTDSDSRLDVNETWIYTCSTTLSETHTNIVTATGWANGISATDIASATVVVGLDVVPPLIHVTKIPNPFTLPVGGGIVTYTYTVTNPGIVALSNVQLTDNKCGPTSFVSGDTNNDSKLDVTETWTYTCSTNITETTLNTAVATGEANGLTVRDFAIATVTVAVPVVATAVPGLPNTGYGSTENIFALSVIAAGIFAASFLLYLTKKDS